MGFVRGECVRFVRGFVSSVTGNGVRSVVLKSTSPPPDDVVSWFRDEILMVGARRGIQSVSFVWRRGRRTMGDGMMLMLMVMKWCIMGSNGNGFAKMFIHGWILV